MLSLEKGTRADVMEHLFPTVQKCIQIFLKNYFLPNNVRRSTLHYNSLSVDRINYKERLLQTDNRNLEEQGMDLKF